MKKESKQKRRPLICKKNWRKDSGPRKKESKSSNPRNRRSKKTRNRPNIKEERNNRRKKKKHQPQNSTTTTSCKNSSTTPKSSRPPASKNSIKSSKNSRIRSNTTCFILTKELIGSSNKTRAMSRGQSSPLTTRTQRAKEATRLSTLRTSLVFRDVFH